MAPIMLKGLSASPGLTMGRIIIYKKKQRKNEKGDLKKESVDPNLEEKRFYEALEKTRQEIIEIRDSMKSNYVREAEIFNAHLMILEDEEFINRIVSLIKNDFLTAEMAIKSVSNYFINLFMSTRNEYFQSKIDDIKDITETLLSYLSNEVQEVIELNEPSIVVALELLPSDTVRIEKEKVLGLVTERGGVTSHVAIIARAMKIPAVVSVERLLEYAKDGDFAILDGTNGVVIINPDTALIEKFSKVRSKN